MAADADSNLSNSYDIKVTPTTTGYINDFSTITRPMTIETATPGTQVVLTNSNGSLAGPDKGIILNFSSLTVDGLQFVGAVSSSGNGAGIRDQGPQTGTVGGTSLIVRNSTFMNNQDGILTGSNSGSSFAETVQIINDTFLNNGSGDGNTHALYVGDAASLDVENSIFCGTNNGHDVKSRATTTTVQGSTMYIGAAGGGCAATNAGAGIDAPNGGIIKLVNDSIIQGPVNSNGALIIVGGESPLLASSLDITGTTLTGDNGASTHPSIGVNELSGCIAPVSGSGNTISGLNTDISPAGCGSLNAAVAVPEPSSLWPLLGAIVGWCAFWGLRVGTG